LSSPRINVLLDDAVVEEREVPYTLSFVNSKIGNGDVGILILQRINSQVVSKFWCVQEKDATS